MNKNKKIKIPLMIVTSHRKAHRFMLPCYALLLTTRCLDYSRKT